MNQSCTFQNEQQRELGCTTELNGSLQHRVIWLRGAKHSSSIDMRIKGQLVFLNAITTVCAYKAQQWQCTWAGFQKSLKGTYSMWKDALAAAKIVTEGMGCTVLLKSPMMNRVLYVTMLCCYTQWCTTPALNRKQTVSAKLPQTALVRKVWKLTELHSVLCMKSNKSSPIISGWLWFISSEEDVLCNGSWNCTSAPAALILSYVYTIFVLKKLSSQ